MLQIFFAVLVKPIFDFFSGVTSKNQITFAEHPGGETNVDKGFHGLWTDKIRHGKTVRVAQPLYDDGTSGQGDGGVTQKTADDCDDEGGKHDAGPGKKFQRIV